MSEQHTKEWYLFLEWLKANHPKQCIGRNDYELAYEHAFAIAYAESRQQRISDLERELAARDLQIGLLCEENRKIEGTRGFCCCGECNVNQLDKSLEAELAAEKARCAELVAALENEFKIYASPPANKSAVLRLGSIISEHSDAIEQGKVSRKLGDYDRWFKPCAKCGFDAGKVSENTENRCWKCGYFLSRDYSDRALKKLDKVLAAGESNE